MSEFWFSSHGSFVSLADIVEETLLKAFWIFKKDKTAEPSRSACFKELIWRLISVITEHIKQNMEIFFKNWDHFTHNSPSSDQLCRVCFVYSADRRQWYLFSLSNILSANPNDITSLTVVLSRDFFCFSLILYKAIDSMIDPRPRSVLFRCLSDTSWQIIIFCACYFGHKTQPA